MNQLTQSLKTYCIGRYLIDMPDDALSRGDATIQGISFEAKRVTLDAFSRELNAYELSLKSRKNRYGYRVLYDYGRVPGLQNGRYFVALDDPDATSDSGRKIEAYKWDAGYSIKIWTDAVDSINSEFEVRMKGAPYEMKNWKVNDVPEKKSLILSFAASVRGRSDDEIPQDPGVCFESGFLPRKAAIGEDVSAFFALKSNTDVSFKLSTDTDLKELPKDTLLSRLPEIRALIRDPNTNGHIVRSGSVDINGIKAEELLLSGVTASRVPGHSFALQANAATSGAMSPYIGLDMSNGDCNNFTGNSIKQASLTEGEAVELWDRISRTLRPRPGAF
ncbi:T6SS immunity protein Tli4 family protein [Burkholderia sp. 22PA0106]|uniref:T6SS immunity protein Tli4 family protein n=1 Tax=Burkholderia sp. 22PA0106 TaxID=3237371 RepID=UPI0039C22830